MKLRCFTPWVFFFLLFFFVPGELKTFFLLIFYFSFIYINPLTNPNPKSQNHEAWKLECGGVALSLNLLALSVNEGVVLVEGLGREEPLEREGGGGGGVGEEEGGEGEGEVGTLDWVGLGGEGEWNWGFGFGVEGGVDGEGSGVEEERAGVRVLEGEEGGGVDGGGREVEVEGEGDVGGGWQSGLRE